MVLWLIPRPVARLDVLISLRKVVFLDHLYFLWKQIPSVILNQAYNYLFEIIIFYAVIFGYLKAIQFPFESHNIEGTDRGVTMTLMGACDKIGCH